LTPEFRCFGAKCHIVLLKLSFALSVAAQAGGASRRWTNLHRSAVNAFVHLSVVVQDVL